MFSKQFPFCVLNEAYLSRGCFLKEGDVKYDRNSWISRARVVNMV